MEHFCRGIIPVMLTAMRNDETIDYAAIRQNVNFLIEMGVDGLFTLGTNGEFYALTEDEKERVAETVMDQAAGRVPIYIGVGEPGTKATIERAKRMEKLKPFALSVVTPYFVTPFQEDLYQHFYRIAQETGAPMLLYNVPARTGVTLEADTLGRLVRDCKNIIGIKDSSGKIKQIQAYLAAVHQDFKVLCGNDGLILEALKLGAVGAVAATANVVPHIVVGIYKAFQQGDLETAHKLQDRLIPLRKDFAMGPVPGILKAQARLSGMAVGPTRSPILPPNDEVSEKLLSVLKTHYSELF